MSQEIQEEDYTSQAQYIIAIHPGSMNIRIGRASDVNPVTEVHAIALKRKPKAIPHKDSLLPPVISKVKDVETEMDNMRLQVSHTLQSCLMSDGRRRYATPPQQISAFNRRSTPIAINNSTGVGDNDILSSSALPLSFDGDVIIGDQVLKLPPDSNYNIHFPIKRGELNLHKSVGGSLTAVMSHLQAIWSWIIFSKLQIKLSELKNYRVALIIPDVYNRQHLKELMNLLFNIGFSSAFLVQDHVGAVFGSGLPSACVIDCGHGKTSVSCVEDGICHPQTRITIPYGGGDVTQCLHWLMNKCGFPYKSCSPDFNNRDALLLERLKRDACHIDLNICGPREETFCVPPTQPSKPSLQYTIQVADECMIAPLALFHPDLFGLTGAKHVRTQKKYTGDSEDPHDADFLRETGRKSTREREEGLVDAREVKEAVSTVDDEFIDILDSTQLMAPDFELSGPISIDQAILNSIQRCSTDEVKRKMYSTILVVGGGMKFKGVSSWLLNKLSLQIPYQYRSDQLEVITNCKEMDPQMVTWKGAVIMACLESAKEIWISSEEWSKHGMKLLRERALFLW